MVSLKLVFWVNPQFTIFEVILKE